jgi:hypothetical protein
MSNTDLLNTHRWTDRPRKFKQGGKSILLRQCASCGRDFAQGLDGEKWIPVYLGAFRVEPLGKIASDRWLSEQCPQKRMPDDDVDRGIVRRS